MYGWAKLLFDYNAHDKVLYTAQTYTACIGKKIYYKTFAQSRKQVEKIMHLQKILLMTLSSLPQVNKLIYINFSIFYPHSTKKHS